MKKPDRSKAKRGEPRAARAFLERFDPEFSRAAQRSKRDRRAARITLERLGR